MILSPEVIILLLQDILLLGFNSFAVWFSFRTSRVFDLTLTSPEQLQLEKQSYLVSTIIQITLSLKLLTFPLFIYALDNLSNLIPGAMCAVGVSNASTLGSPLLLLKLLSIYLYGFWLVLHRADMQTLNYAHTRNKYTLYLFVYLFFLVELLLQYAYLLDLDLESVVSCCGTVFSAGSSNLGGQLLNIPNTIIVPVFYVTWLLSAFASFKKDIMSAGIANIFFIIIALLSIISFFGTYIYQLPTHLCPFCFLQKEYYYVGYLIYPLLLAGSFFGISPLFLQWLYGIESKSLKLSVLLNTLFVLLVSAYPLIYFLKNGVWL